MKNFIKNILQTLIEEIMYKDVYLRVDGLNILKTTMTHVPAVDQIILIDELHSNYDFLVKKVSVTKFGSVVYLDGILTEEKLNIN